MSSQVIPSQVKETVTEFQRGSTVGFLLLQCSSGVVRQGSPGVGRNTFLSSPHLCFITVFICDLFVSGDDPLMS